MRILTSIATIVGYVLILNVLDSLLTDSQMDFIYALLFVPLCGFFGAMFVGALREKSKTRIVADGLILLVTLALFAHSVVSVWTVLP